MLVALTCSQCCAEQLTNPMSILFGVQITIISLFAQYGVVALPHLSGKSLLLDSSSADRLSSRESASGDVAQSGVTWSRDLTFIVFLCSVQLILFKEISAVYSDDHTKPINTKYSVTDS
jgi:hypothetical protein